MQVRAPTRKTGRLRGRFFFEIVCARLPDDFCVR
jgi:hypothetical protein